MLAKITLQDDGTPLVSQVVCIEAEYRPETEDDKEKIQQESI